MDFLKKLDDVIDSISTVLDDDTKISAATNSGNTNHSSTHKKKKGHEWRDEEAEAEFLSEKSTKFLTNFKAVRSGPPKCILVVDGGGLKGYMSIQILKTLETELKKLDKNFELNKAFDLVMGTSTGGLISIGLGKLELSCDEIADMYDEVGSKVFATHSSDNYIPDTVEDWFVGAWRGVKTASSMVGNVGGLDTDELVKVLKNRIKRYTGSSNTSMYEPEKSYQTKCGVITTLCNNNDFQNAMIIRSYNINREIVIYNRLKKLSKEGISDEKEIENALNTSTKFDKIGHSECDRYFHCTLPGIHECAIWEAARATSAAPTYFQDMFINMPKSLSVDVIKRNICHATRIGKNPCTGLYDFTKMYLPSKEDLQSLHKCAHDVYLLKYDKDNAKRKKDEIIDALNEIVKHCIKSNKDCGSSDSSNSNSNSNSDGHCKDLHNYKKLDSKTFDNEIYDVKYNLRFQDGGLSANSPIMSAFVDGTRMWPDSDILILSIGTGVTEIKDYYKHGCGEPHFGRVFASMFGAKDITGLFEMVSLSGNKEMGVHLQRMNPEVPEKSESGGDLLDMADYNNMNEWKKIGKEFGDNHREQLSHWAKFLYDNKQNKQTK